MIQQNRHTINILVLFINYWITFWCNDIILTALTHHNYDKIIWQYTHLPAQELLNFSIICHKLHCSFIIVTYLYSSKLSHIVNHLSVKLSIMNIWSRNKYKYPSIFFEYFHVISMMSLLVMNWIHITTLVLKSLVSSNLFLFHNFPSMAIAWVNFSTSVSISVICKKNKTIYFKMFLFLQFLLSFNLSEIVTGLSLYV